MTEGAVITRKLCLLGFGNVGRRFVELVARKSDELDANHGLRLLFSAVSTAHHGALLAPEGLTAAAVIEGCGCGPGAELDPQDLWTFPDPARPSLELIAESGADVLIEATPLDPHGGRAAIAHIEEAFASGMDVVSVNKGPIAWDYHRLAGLADRRGRRLLFEGTVMDGCPVFDLFRSCLPGCRLLGFDAVFNATTNYILDRMGEGVGFADALAQVQAQGYAESDPSHDIDGHDGAAKTAALANVLMHARVTPDDIDKVSIRDVTPEQVAAVRAAGRRLRVVCSAMSTDVGLVAGGSPASSAGAPTGMGPGGGAPVRVFMGLAELTSDHPLFTANGSTLGVLLHTDLMGTIEVAEHDVLPDQTAYAIYTDLLALHEGR